MTVTTTGLTKAAGIAAAAAGAIFIAVQIGHPACRHLTTDTTEWVVRSSAKMVMAVLALAGITGMYLRQSARPASSASSATCVFAVGYLPCSPRGHRRLRPARPGDTEPGYVNDVVAAAAGGTPIGDIGGLQTLFNVTGAGYIARRPALRHRAVPRPRPLPLGGRAARRRHRRHRSRSRVLPESFNRPIAVPERHRADRPGRLDCGGPRVRPRPRDRRAATGTTQAGQLAVR